MEAKKLADEAVKEEMKALGILILMTHLISWSFYRRRPNSSVSTQAVAQLESMGIGVV